MKPFSICNLCLEPSQCNQERLAIFHLPDGTEIDIPLVAVRDKKDRPVLWLGTAMHEQELLGIPLILKIIKERTDLETLCKKVVDKTLWITILATLAFTRPRGRRSLSVEYTQGN